MPAVAEMTLQDYRDGFSDLFKDAYGYRPRFDTSHYTEQEWISQYDYLHDVIARNNAAEAESEARAVAKFEADIQKLIAMGAADRATAIRWIADAEGVDGDLDYLAFLLGLPYRYFLSFS